MYFNELKCISTFAEFVDGENINFERLKFLI